MENGVDWNITLSYLQSQTFKSTDEYASKCALEAIISGSTWSNARIHEIDENHCEFCPRCGVIDSDLHTFWLCPANRNIDHTAITSTDKLTRIACDESVDFPCLWLRGICPKKLTSIPEAYLPTSEYIIKYIAYDSPIAAAIVVSGTYYGDASGGRFSSYGPLIRCGIGLVKIGYDNCNNIYREWGVQLNLPGVVQTVPRAELYALQYLLNEAAENAEIEVITDNKKNSETFNKGPDAGARSLNHDMFKDIFSCIQTKNLTVCVRWMPSHQQDKIDADENFQLPQNVSLSDVQGNSWADELAGASAQSLELPLNVTSPYIYHKNLVKRI